MRIDLEILFRNKYLCFICVYLLFINKMFFINILKIVEDLRCIQLTVTENFIPSQFKQ